MFSHLYTSISQYFTPISTESLNYIHNVGFKMMRCVGIYTIFYMVMRINSITVRDITIENIMSKVSYYKQRVRRMVSNDLHDLDEPNKVDKNLDKNLDKNPEKVSTKKKVYDITNYKEKYLDKFDKVIVKNHTPEELNMLKSNLVIENTPHGNVVMYWDNEKNSFVYYADGSIPYYALEVVARKYVINNNCKSIFVDMNCEINLAKQKLENKKINATISVNGNKLQDVTDKLSENTSKNTKSTLNIFAKFKKYNTESIKSSVVVKDSSTKQTGNAGKTSSKQVNNSEETILKEKANRYSYEGKIANFSFLKKVDKKVTDKKYTLSFSEFKMLRKQNK